MRLIDGDALAKFIDYGHLNNPNEKLYSENDIREMIDMMPTVDAAPAITGTWTVEHDPNDVPFMQTKYRCSACGGWNTYGKTKYCPNCGARMDGND